MEARISLVLVTIRSPKLCTERLEHASRRYILSDARLPRTSPPAAAPHGRHRARPRRPLNSSPTPATRNHHQRAPQTGRAAAPRNTTTRPSGTAVASGRFSGRDYSYFTGMITQAAD